MRKCPFMPFFGVVGAEIVRDLGDFFEKPVLRLRLRSISLFHFYYGISLAKLF